MHFKWILKTLLHSVQGKYVLLWSSRRGRWSLCSSVNILIGSVRGTEFITALVCVLLLYLVSADHLQQLWCCGRAACMFCDFCCWWLGSSPVKGSCGAASVGFQLCSGIASSQHCLKKKRTRNVMHVWNKKASVSQRLWALLGVSKQWRIQPSSLSLSVASKSVFLRWFSFIHRLNDYVNVCCMCALVIQRESLVIHI